MSIDQKLKFSGNKKCWNGVKQIVAIDDCTKEEYRGLIKSDKMRFETEYKEKKE